MTTYETIESEMKEAMRQKDVLKLSVLRMVVAGIKNAEIAKKVKKLEEDDVIQVIRKIIREHKESISQFEKGNRPDLVSKETAEMEILQKYVPQEMGEEELASIIKSTLQEIGAVTKADTGKAMKAVMDKINGRADGKTAARIVSSFLK